LNAMTSGSAEPLLSVSGLRVTFGSSRGDLVAVDGVDFEVGLGEVLGIAGESGSGKSVTLRSILRLVRPPGRVSGKVTWRGRDLLTMAEPELRRVRGGEIGVIFQEPMTALNPVLTVGLQIRENLKEHTNLDPAGRQRRAVELMDQVGIPAGKSRLEDYPHQFSGGMRQRAMIAIALASNPRLLLADEPTTALDVTIQAQVLELMKGLSQKYGTAVMLITHDLGVVAGICQHVNVMYAGHIIESASVKHIFETPAHPYTVGLLQSIPHLDEQHGARLTSIPGQPPDLINPLVGCPYAPRCPKVQARCREERTELMPVGRGEQVAACFYPN